MRILLRWPWSICNTPVSFCCFSVCGVLSITMMTSPLVLSCQHDHFFDTVSSRTNGATAAVLSCTRCSALASPRTGGNITAIFGTDQRMGDRYIRPLYQTIYRDNTDSMYQRDSSAPCMRWRVLHHSAHKRCNKYYRYPKILRSSRCDVSCFTTCIDWQRRLRWQTTERLSAFGSSILLEAL